MEERILRERLKRGREDPERGGWKHLKESVKGIDLVLKVVTAVGQ